MYFMHTGEVHVDGCIYPAIPAHSKGGKVQEKKKNQPKLKLSCQSFSGPPFQLCGQPEQVDKEHVCHGEAAIYIRSGCSPTYAFLGLITPPCFFPGLFFVCLFVLFCKAARALQWQPSDHGLCILFYVFYLF